MLSKQRLVLIAALAAAPAAMSDTIHQNALGDDESSSTSMSSPSSGSVGIKSGGGARRGRGATESSMSAGNQPRRPGGKFSSQTRRNGGQLQNGITYTKIERVMPGPKVTFLQGAQQVLPSQVPPGTRLTMVTKKGRFEVETLSKEEVDQLAEQANNKKNRGVSLKRGRGGKAGLKNVSGVKPVGRPVGFDSLGAENLDYYYTVDTGAPDDIRNLIDSAGLRSGAAKLLFDEDPETRTAGLLSGGGGGGEAKNTENGQ